MLALLSIGTAAGIIIGSAAKADVGGVLLSVALSSFLFSLCGIFVAAKTGSDFMLATCLVAPILMGAVFKIGVPQFERLLCE